MKRLEKTILVDNLSEELKSAKSVVLINFVGMTVKTQQELKKRLKEAGASMLVVKNTLLKRAGESAKIDKNVLSDTILAGQTALIIGKDNPISPIQVLGKFAKEFESGAGYPVPQFKVGVVESMFQDTESLIKISNLPGREALLGQLLGALLSSQYGLVSTLQGNMQKLVYILDSKAKGGE